MTKPLRVLEDKVNKQTNKQTQSNASNSQVKLMFHLKRAWHPARFLYLHTLRSRISVHQNLFEIISQPTYVYVFSPTQMGFLLETSEYEEKSTPSLGELR